MRALQDVACILQTVCLLGVSDLPHSAASLSTSCTQLHTGGTTQHAPNTAQPQSTDRHAVHCAQHISHRHASCIPKQQHACKPGRLSLNRASAQMPQHKHLLWQKYGSSGETSQHAAPPLKRHTHVQVTSRQHKLQSPRRQTWQQPRSLAAQSRTHPAHPRAIHMCTN